MITQSLVVSCRISFSVKSQILHLILTLRIEKNSFEIHRYFDWDPRCWVCIWVCVYKEITTYSTTKVADVAGLKLKWSWNSPHIRNVKLVLLFNLLSSCPNKWSFFGRVRSRSMSVFGNCTLHNVCCYLLKIIFQGQCKSRTQVGSTKQVWNTSIN